MPMEESGIKTEHGELIHISWDEVSQNLDDIKKSGAPIWRQKKDGKFVTIPPSKLDQFLGGKQASTINFFIEKEWRNRILNKDAKFDPTKLETETQKPEKKIKPKPKPEPVTPKVDNKLKIDYNNYNEMPFQEREEKLSEGIDEFNKRVELYDKIDMDTINDLVDIVSDTWHINRSALNENTDSKENEQSQMLFTQSLERLVEKTNVLVESILSLLNLDIMKYSDLNLIENISTGSVTVDHINKVLLRFIPYCVYYNEYFTSGRIKKIRANFQKRFKNYYRDKEVRLETIFKGGIRRLTEEEMHAYSLGALLHDIGKLPEIDYHDNKGPDDRKKIMSHGPLSYNMIIKSKMFSWDVAYMALLHHEYYSDPSGYNFSVQLFPKLSKNKAEGSQVSFFISYDINDLKEGNAVAYFPAKVLEIIDVYDELIEKNLSGKGGGYTPEEALVIMMKDYIVKSLRLDPILFAIFVDFVKEYADIKNPDNINFF